MCSHNQSLSGRRTSGITSITMKIRILIRRKRRRSIMRAFLFRASPRRNQGSQVKNQENHPRNQESHLRSQENQINPEIQRGPNQTNQTSLISPTNQINRISQTNQINRISQTNQTSLINQTNRTNPMDQNDPIQTSQTMTENPNLARKTICDQS